MTLQFIYRLEVLVHALPMPLSGEESKLMFQCAEQSKPMPK